MSSSARSTWLRLCTLCSLSIKSGLLQGASALQHDYMDPVISSSLYATSISLAEVIVQSPEFLEAPKREFQLDWQDGTSLRRQSELAADCIQRHRADLRSEANGTKEANGGQIERRDRPC